MSETDTPVGPDVLFLSVRALSEKIRRHELSPFALTGAYLDRLEKVGPSLGAVVTVTRDLAMSEAKAAEAEIAKGRWRGPLHGIPYGVKDLLATVGIPTTWGAEPFRDQVFDFDATVVRKLREAGAVLIGKLSMIELAGAFGYNNADASLTGPCRNPWNMKFWSGGSSSGPAAATAASLVAFSIGSETSGSILTPAAFSGISGLRPTYGRASRHGAMPLSPMLDKLGPICRTAEDCGLVMEAITGSDPLDPTTVDRPWMSRPSETRRYRVGVISGSARGAQPQVKKNFEAAVKVLRAFCGVEDEVPFPEFPYSRTMSTLIKSDAAAAFHDLIESGATRTLRAARNERSGFSTSPAPAANYKKAQSLRIPIQRALDALYSNYDALISPSCQTVASPISVDFDKAYPGAGGGPAVIPAGNLAGQPALSVPDGFGENGLPTGILFTGRAFADETLVAIATEYQRRTIWHTRRPPV
jgi:aspartyl-tRNA(Asn)/glutamyl-tRNA(Gln) amidotransferase subunit A